MMLWSTTTCVYLLELPQCGDSHKSLQNRFRGVNNNNDRIFITILTALQWKILFKSKLLGKRYYCYNKGPLHQTHVQYMYQFMTLCMPWCNTPILISICQQQFTSIETKVNNTFSIKKKKKTKEFGSLLSHPTEIWTQTVITPVMTSSFEGQLLSFCTSKFFFFFYFKHAFSNFLPHTSFSFCLSSFLFQDSSATFVNLFKFCLFWNIPLSFSLVLKWRITSP